MRHRPAIWGPIIVTTKEEKILFSNTAGTRTRYQLVPFSIFGHYCLLHFVFIFYAEVLIYGIKVFDIDTNCLSIKFWMLWDIFHLLFNFSLILFLLKNFSYLLQNKMCDAFHFWWIGFLLGFFWEISVSWVNLSVGLIIWGFPLSIALGVVQDIECQIYRGFVRLDNSLLHLKPNTSWIWYTN